jgi:hypothetical protein
VAFGTGDEVGGHVDSRDVVPSITRRRFLRQTVAFSAPAALGSIPGVAALGSSDPATANLLMIDDRGYHFLPAVPADEGDS